MTDKRNFFVDWDRQVDSKNCPQQVDLSIRQTLWDSTIAVDELGSRWGESGVRRSPAFTAVGWITGLPGRVQAPTLVIRGALDDQAPEQATRALYDALGGPKAYATVSCGSHELVYEKQHTKLLEASAEWLRFGTYEGRSPGATSSGRAPVGIRTIPLMLATPVFSISSNNLEPDGQRTPAQAQGEMKQQGRAFQTRPG